MPRQRYGHHRSTIVVAVVFGLMVLTACETPQPASHPTTPPPPSKITGSLIPAIVTTLAPLANNPDTTGAGQPGPGAGTALAWALNQPGGQGLSAGQEFSLKISLNPTDRGVSGVQFTLHFPPQIVQVLDTAPGSLLGPEPLEIEQGGMEPGEFVLAMARRGETVAPTAAAPLAKIRLKVNRKTAEDGDVIIWLDRIKVVDELFQVIGNPALTGSMSRLD